MVIIDRKVAASSYIVVGPIHHHTQIYAQTRNNFMIQQHAYESYSSVTSGLNSVCIVVTLRQNVNMIMNNSYPTTMYESI